MFGQKSPMTTLAARKKLLLMESQFNRAAFLAAAHDLKAEFHHSVGQLSSVGSIMSIAGKIASFVPSLTQLFSRHSSAGPSRKRPSLLHGMLTGTTLWVLLRMFRRKN